MRALLYVILLIVLYQAIKTIIRSAVSAYGGKSEGSQRRPARLRGEEMVQDPQCRTYIVRDRAVTRRVDGAMTFFCSDACAEEYLRTKRS